MPFFEVSCKNNINIEEAFLTLARKIREYRDSKVKISKNIFDVPYKTTPVALKWHVGFDKSSSILSRGQCYAKF